MSAIAAARRAPLLLVLLLGCPAASTSEDPPTPAAAVFSVSTAEARADTVVDPVIVTGVVEPRRDVTVLSEGSGRVLELPARLGQTVAKGQVLARLDAVIAQARLDQAEAQAEQAAAALELTETDAARTADLHAQGATTDRDKDASAIQLRSAKAQLQAAQASVTLARRAVEDTAIRAPFAGAVSGVHLEVGAVIAPGTPAFGLVDLSEGLVSAGISGREVPLVEEGQPVLVRVPSLGERTFEGSVRAVAPASNPQTRTWPVEVAIPNPDGELRGGMVARVEIVVGERQGVLVPDGAIVEGTQGAKLFVVQGDVAVQRAVSLGRSADGEVEVRTGVSAGELVAVLGSQRLSDGASVSVYDMGEPAATGLPPAPE